jgi:ion channel-forming bestrophin family protein
MKLDKQSLKLAATFKGAILKRLLAGMTVLTAITTTLIYIHNHNSEYQKLNMTVSGALPGYMGAALGLLLVFRNSTAYDKWWEARKEIGALVNTARNFAITLNGLLPFNTPERRQLTKLLVAFVFNLKAHLRDSSDEKSLDALSTEDRELVLKSQHKPVVISNIMINKIEDVWKRNLITDIQQSLLIEKIHGLVDILGKCERIKNTPIPMAYMFLLKFLINIYVVILPFSLVDEIGWLCIPLVILLYYILMSIVITAEEIEEPFGYDLNDLKMDAIAINIKNNIDEIVTHD